MTRVDSDISHLQQVLGVCRFLFSPSLIMWLQHPRKWMVWERGREETREEEEVGNSSSGTNKEEGKLTQNGEDDSLSNLTHTEGSHCLGEMGNLLSLEVSK